MSFSKKVVMTLFISFFVSGVIFAIESTVLKIDINNAIQEIGSIVLYDEGEQGTLQGILTEANGKLKITGSGNNFIINIDNDIYSGENSSILGGINNRINVGNYSTVFGGSGNDIESDYSIILGGMDNYVYSNSIGSVIAGGKDNKINSLLDRNLENSVVIGNNNEMNGSYSSVVGENSVVGNNEYNETYNSVAMGSGAVVIGNNSFLRVDGSEKVDLYNNEVFAIFSKNGMSVNQSDPNTKAKFNVGGYFVIAAGNSGNNIQCGSGNGTGIIKVQDRDDIQDQKCFCSCDGTEWKSMIGDGQCESICKGEKSDVFPECVEGGIKIIQSGDTKMYSGECIGGSVIEGSYFMNGNTIWWQCQGKNGNTTGCSYKSECTGFIPGLDEGAVQINNNIVPSISSDQRQYKYSDDKLEVCTYSCNTGYALDNSSIRKCSKVCDEYNKNCNLGVIKNLNIPTFTNDYKYGCLYDEKLFECEANCDVGQIWNGSNCVSMENVCGSEKYTCLLGNVGNTGMNLENYTWNCVDSNDNVIGELCLKPKEIVNKIVYYNNVRGSDRKQNVYFSITSNDIPVDIKIKQEYSRGIRSYEKYYTIPANQSTSNKEVFDQGDYLSGYTWLRSNDYTIMGDSVYIPVGDKLYILKMERYDGLCVNTCSTAGQCLRGGNTSNFRGNKTGSVNKGDEYMFTWSCKLGSRTENCEARCPLDAGKCGSAGTIANSVNCDPSSDSECNIWGTGNMIVNDFYMDKSEEKIVGSKCGIKRHCVYHALIGVTCTESIENCQQKGFKCKDGFVLSGCNCISISDVCNKTTNPGKCITGMMATGYAGEIGKSNYSYYCEKNGMQRVFCEANCGSGQIWNGSKCIGLPNLCGERHNNCINQATSTSNQRDEFEKKYKRTCKLGNNIQNCSECYSGYVMSGSECKVKPAIDCEATEFNGYRVPYLANGSGKQVEKNTRTSVCKLQVKCETGVIKSYSTEFCKNVCNTGTNLGTCITGSSVIYPYIGNLGDSSYKYQCKNNSGFTFDLCNAKCPSGQYWNGSNCGKININLCGENHYNCINGSVGVYSNMSSSVNNGYTTYTYKWWCKLGDYSTGCIETENVVHNCKAGTYSGYYVRNNLNNLQEMSVTKIVDGVNCTATAVCGSGNISIKDENCTNACPGGILDVPKCNFNGVNPSYLQSATWTSSYTYKCGSYQCSANCSDNKIWNGSKCVSHYAPYCSNTDLSCIFGIVKQVSVGNWGSTWNCININNENLNDNICYKCKDGYLWKSEGDICEEKSCGAMSNSGYSIQSLSGSTSIIVSKNIKNGSCTATASCSKGEVTVKNESCTCNDGYYLDGGVCNSICGNGLDTPCNGPYTASGIIRGNGYTLRGKGYSCNKNTNSSVIGSNIRQCECPEGSWWKGSVCTIKSNSFCDNTTIDGCVNSVLVERTGGVWGNIWKCGVQGMSPEICYKCSGDYDWDGQSCVRTKFDCGGTRPTGEGVVTNSKDYYTEDEEGYDEWTYVPPNNDVDESSCAWTCRLGYDHSEEYNTCKKNLCGSADKGRYTELPLDNLCLAGNYQGLHKVFNGSCEFRWEWKCGKGLDESECSAGASYCPIMINLTSRNVVSVASDLGCFPYNHYNGKAKINVVFSDGTKQERIIPAGNSATFDKEVSYVETVSFDPKIQDGGVILAVGMTPTSCE